MTSPRWIFLTGGTGLVGRRVAKALLDRGDRVRVLTRRRAAAEAIADLQGAELVEGDPAVAGDWMRRLDDCSGVVNLAGEPIFSGHGVFGVFRLRWSSETKKAIRESRIQATRNVAQAARQAAIPPEVWVQASAIGYYGPRGDEAVDENASPGDDFLAQVCRDWEAEARTGPAATRLAILRIGVVLERDSGALGMLGPLVRWIPFAAAPIGGGRYWWSPGNGSQWMSWIEIEDLTRMILWALDEPKASGPINAAAPEPARNVDFMKALARELHRPSLPFGPPAAALRLVMGEAASTFLFGQRVLPKRALDAGFSFRFPRLEPALARIFRKNA